MSEQSSVQPIFTESQLCYFSRQFSNMFGLPVSLYRQQEKIYTYSPVQLAADPVTLCIDALLQETAPLGYFAYHDMFYYGYVRHQLYCFVAGPVSELAISEHELKKLGGSLHLQPEQFSVFVAEMKTLSGMHPDTLLQAMILYNFTVNRTMYDISDLRIQQKEQKTITAEMKENEILSGPENRNPEGHMRSLSIEQDIIRKVQQGDVDGLIDGAAGNHCFPCGDPGWSACRRSFRNGGTLHFQMRIPAGHGTNQELAVSHDPGLCRSGAKAETVRRQPVPIGAKCVAVYPQPYGRTDPHRRHRSILRQKPRRTDYGIQKANRQDAV